MRGRCGRQGWQKKARVETEKWEWLRNEGGFTYKEVTASNRQSNRSVGSVALLFVFKIERK